MKHLALSPAGWASFGLFTMVVVGPAHGAPGALDPSFAGTGLSRIGFGFGYSQGHAAAVQPDGKLVIAGNANLYHSGGGDFAVARFTTNNVLDSSFGQGGKVLTSVVTPGVSIYAVDANATAVQIQADGKIVAAGYGWNNTNYHSFTLVRYNPDGSVDTTFGTNGTGVVYLDFGQQSQISAMVLQPDGNIVVAGVSGNTTSFALARYQTNGTLDASFGTGGTVVTPVTFGTASGLLLEADRKIVAVGSGEGPGHSGSDFAVFRYTTNGVLDASFGGGTGEVFTHISPIASGYSDSANAVGYQLGNNTPQNPDKLVVAGMYTQVASPALWGFAVARYNLDGSLDTSFGNGGIVTNSIGSASAEGDFAQAVIVQGFSIHPRLITVGGYGQNGSDYYFALARYTASGALDTSFGGNGTGKAILHNAGTAYSMALQSGEFVLAGTVVLGSDLSDFTAARFTSGGVLDTNFGTAGIITADMIDNTAQATSLAIQPNGAIVVAGEAYNTLNNICALARYNPDGSLDASFGANGKVTTSLAPIPNAVQVQKDGRIVGAGQLNGFALVRYNPDGSLDGSFGSGGISTNGPSGLPYGMVLQPDGKIVIAGKTSGATPAFELARYGTNGALDTSFGGAGSVITPIGFGYSAAQGVALQSDGKIVAAGYAVGSSGYFALARYETNGALDTSFGSLGKVITDFGPGNLGEAFSVAVQPDGRIVVAGAFDNGNVYFALARYTSTGALDSSFGSGGTVATQAGFDYAYATDVALQPNGKIVAAGLSQVGSNYQYAVVRYNPDGSLDNSYGSAGVVLVSFADGGSDSGAGVALDQIGRAVVVGSANNLFGVARLQSDPYLEILSIARAANGHVQLQGLGVPNAANTLWGATNLLRSNFGAIGSVLPDASGSWQYDDATAVGLSHRFYQLSFP